MHLTAPAIFAPSGMNGWPGWLLITPAATSMALTYCDMTTGPAGGVIT
jgi:hypothetical protein